MLGLNTAPPPSGSLQVNCARACASSGTPLPFFLVHTPSIAPILSTIGNALIGVVDCRLSQTISGKHGFLLNTELEQFKLNDGILPSIPKFMSSNFAIGPLVSKSLALNPSALPASGTIAPVLTSNNICCPKNVPAEKPFLIAPLTAVNAAGGLIGN